MTRGRKAIDAMNRLSDAIAASGATEEELQELERALDRKAPEQIRRRGYSEEAQSS